MIQMTKSALFMALGSLASGCIMLGLTPLPGYITEVAAPAGMSNTELSKKILGLLAASGINDCSSNHDTCEFNGLSGVDVTGVEPSLGIILINHYTEYDKNRAGIGMKIERVSADVLRVTARGVGPYYTELPTEDAAKSIATIISNGLGEGSG